MTSDFSASIRTPFQKYACAYVPIGVDLVAYELVKRVTKSTKAGQAAGFLAAAGAWFVLSNRASPMIRMAGAGLYVAYKVVHYYFTSVSPLRSEQKLLKTTKELYKSLEITDDKITEFTGDAKTTLLDRCSAECRANWLKPETLTKALLVMTEAEAVLLKVMMHVQRVPEYLNAKAEERTAKMAEMLKDTTYNPDDEFGKALKIFLETYRLARGVQYFLKLASVKGWNSSLPQSTFASGDDETFMRGNGVQHQMHQLYNKIITDFSHLVAKTSYDFSHYMVVDSAAIPGDEGLGNPSNPFKIEFKQPVHKE